MKKHKCMKCEKEYTDYFTPLKLISCVFCSAECYNEYYIKNSATMTFSSFPFVKNYKEVLEVSKNSKSIMSYKKGDSGITLVKRD